MTHPESIALQRLLDRAEATALLAAFARPGAGLALVRPDGRLFVSAGTWAVGELDAARGALGGAGAPPSEPRALANSAGCAYPLVVGPQAHLAGWLLVRPTDELDEAHTAGLRQALVALLSQALAKRDIATETLDRYREINLLYRVGETIGACLDPALIPGLVLEESNRVIPADAGLVLIAGEEASEPEMKAGLGSAEGMAALAHAARSVVEQVQALGRPAIVTDLPAVPDGMRWPAYGAVLCAPLKAREHVLGTVVIGRTDGGRVFAAADEKMLMALAGQAAIALENARLHQEALEKERLERELQLAFSVQSSLLPRAVPQLPGWEFAAWWQPARDVSGDFYDFIEHDGGQLGVVVADVSDKGMPAALFMALTRSIVRASTVARPSPAGGLTQANRLLCADATGGMFVTVFYARLDPASGAFTYVNGGHNPPFHYRARLGTVSQLTANNIMLGFDETWSFEEHTATLEPGDLVVLYTDGVTEALNPHGDRFEEERLQALLHENRCAPAGQLLAVIRAALASFMAGTAPVDDITLVIARRLGPDSG